MNKILVIAFAAAVSTFGSGCATLGNSTLASELVNDHEPGTATWAQPGAANLTVKKDAGPAGSVCRFGTDCQSGACEQGVCEDFSDDSTHGGRVLLATDP